MSTKTIFTLEKKHVIYNKSFGLLCTSSLFFSASFNMLIPELPAYLSSLGGEEYKGLIISLFTLTAGLSRPFSGKLTDKIGRRPVMITGAMVCLLCGFLYPVTGSVAGFLFLRLFHGFSTGFSPTAMSTYISDIVPSKNWGEAMGIQGLCFSTGMALGPAIGSYIKLYYSFDTLFYSSSFFALLSVISVMNLKETLSNKHSFKLSILKITRKDIMAIEVLSPAIVTFLSYLAFGMMLTLIPDWSDYLGIINKGMFFIVFTISSLFIRFIAGKLSDKYGRIPVIYIGLSLLFAAMVVMGYFASFMGLIIASVIYGLSMGILSPTLNAWTVDLSYNNQRGKAIATMYIALEAGIGIGALVSGWYYQNIILNIPKIMYACAGMALVAVIFICIKFKHLRQIFNSMKHQL